MASRPAMNGRAIRREKRGVSSGEVVIRGSPFVCVNERSLFLKWGKIVCRCENITEAEVIKSLSNPLGAQTLSSVKYRCRAGMGRCQGGFCTQHIVRIMEENFNIDINKMNLKSPNSNLFFGRTREK